MNRTAWLCLIGTFVATALGGCGGREGAAPSAAIDGVVYLGDRPVEAGLVTLVAEDGRSASAQLGPGGKFTLNAAPLGKVYVGVNTQMLRGQSELTLKQTKGQERLQFVEVPARYADPKNSGITATVEPGKTLQIRLKP